MAAAFIAARWVPSRAQTTKCGRKHARLHRAALPRRRRRRCRRRRRRRTTINVTHMVDTGSLPKAAIRIASTRSPITGAMHRQTSLPVLTTGAVGKVACVTHLARAYCRLRRRRPRRQHRLRRPRRRCRHRRRPLPRRRGPRRRRRGLRHRGRQRLNLSGSLGNA